MFKVINVFSAVIGLIIALLSKAQNPFLLCFGCGIFVASIFTFIIKKHAKYLLIPFIIILGGGLFFFNKIDFKANSFKVDFFDASDYQTYLQINYFNQDTNNIKVAQGEAVPDLGLNRAEQINFIFEKDPLLIGEEMILTDYQATEQTVEATWYWSGDSNFKRIIDSQYLHIYDPVKNIYYPSTEHAFDLSEMINFYVIDTLSNDELLFNQISVDDLYYQTRPGYYNFNSPLESILIHDLEANDATNYDVYINGKLLKQEDSENGWYCYVFSDQVDVIENVMVVETRPSETNFSINLLQPINIEIFTIESEPDPIIIEKLSLYKYLGSINKFFPFYDWKANTLQTEYSANEGELHIENNLLYLVPTGITPSLKLMTPPATIEALGLANYKSTILFVNIFSTVLLLVFFIGSSVFLDKYRKILQKNLNKVENWVKNKLIPTLQKQEWRTVKPFTITVILFFLISWTLIIFPLNNNGLRIVLIVVNLLLSPLLCFYIFSNSKVRHP